MADKSLQVIFFATFEWSVSAANAFFCVFWARGTCLVASNVVPLL